MPKLIFRESFNLLSPLSYELSFFINVCRGGRVLLTFAASHVFHSLDNFTADQ